MTRRHQPFPLDLIRLLILSLALALAAGSAGATGFLPSVQGLPSWEVLVTTAEGQEIHGVISTTLFNWRGVRRITVRDLEGKKHKLEAQDIATIVVPLDGPMGRESLLFEATSTLAKAAKTDYRQIKDTTEMVFDSLAFPKPDKRVLLPLVNPAFSRRIRVYGLLNDREMTHTFHGIALFGDEPDAFVVVKDGGKPWKVEDDDYEDQFERLFGDCPEVMRQFGDDPDFDDMAKHVLAFESLCPAAGLPG